MQQVKTYLKLFLLAAAAMVSAHSWAQDSTHSRSSTTLPNGIAQLRAFSTDLSSLKAEFIQYAFDLDGQREESTGNMLMQKPDRLRWDYITPFEQRIIADGTQVWTYDVDLDQVTVRDQGEALSRSALSALTDSARLDRYFELENAGEEEGLNWVRLLPRQHNGEGSGDNEEAGNDHEFEQIVLGFKDNELRRMLIADRLGQNTDIVFTSMIRNVSLEPALFQFTPPEGVDVIGDLEL
ncbi:MAG: outer-membrane lipoprotein carrier protein LolA [Xanthomonadales bacterium]|nr:outer-membrane lipoprotein carrier protein LolA [Xanthomonadales bacterium]